MFMRTTFLSIALVPFLLQANSCQKKPDPKAETTSPTPVVSPLRSTTAPRTTAAPSADNQASVQRGIWSGPGVTLQITASGADVEFDCAHGTIKEPLVADSNGAFDVAGTFAPEGGPGQVPVNGVSQEKKFSARYRGRIEGEKMTLNVLVSETGANLTDFSLVRGRPARLEKCY